MKTHIWIHLRGQGLDQLGQEVIGHLDALLLDRLDRNQLAGALEDLLQLLLCLVALQLVAGLSNHVLAYRADGVRVHRHLLGFPNGLDAVAGGTTFLGVAGKEADIKLANFFFAVKINPSE